MTSLCWLFTILAFTPTLLANHPVNQVTILAEWGNLEFGFDSVEQKNYAIKQGYYSPEGQKRIYEMDIYFKPNGEIREFVTIPRLDPNVPFTVATIDKKNNTCHEPLLRAYPNMDWHLNRTCDRIIGVFRLTVDNDCKQLWIIDSGRDITLGAQSQICPPKILVFDLETDDLLHIYIIPDVQYFSGKSGFSFITLNPKRSCNNQIAYVTDPRGPGMVVFNLNTMTSWRTFSGRYAAEPEYQMATIAGESFDLPDGIYCVAPNIIDDKMYFHSFASLDEVVVPMGVIHDRNLWTSNANTEKFFKRIGRRPTQSTIEAFDSRGNLWFSLLNPLAIVCWNPRNPYSIDNFKFVLVDKVRLQFVSGLKIQRDPRRGEILIVTSNRQQKHFNGTVNPNEINYRAFYISIKNIDCINV